MARATPNYAAIPIVAHDAVEFANIEKLCKTRSRSSWCKLLTLNRNEIVSYSEHPVCIGSTDRRGLRFIAALIYATFSAIKMPSSLRIITSSRNRPRPYICLSLSLNSTSTSASAPRPSLVSWQCQIALRCMRCFSDPHWNLSRCHKSVASFEFPQLLHLAKGGEEAEAEADAEAEALNSRTLQLNCRARTAGRAMYNSNIVNKRSNNNKATIKCLVILSDPSSHRRYLQSTRRNGKMNLARVHHFK